MCTLIFKLVIEKQINKTIIFNGFRTCGWFPWNADALGYSKSTNSSVVLEPKIVMNYKTFKTIVGFEILTKFKQYDKMQHDEYFSNTIKILFKKFKEIRMQ